MGIKQSLQKKMLIKLSTDGIMEFLGKLDSNRTIGSITRKEVKVLVTENVDKLMKMQGIM